MGPKKYKIICYADNTVLAKNNDDLQSLLNLFNTIVKGIIWKYQQEKKVLNNIKWLCQTQIRSRQQYYLTSYDFKYIGIDIPPMGTSKIMFDSKYLN